MPFRRDHYGIYFPSYFTGPSGREIQAAGADACVLGVYLGVNQHATMIGLYPLPMIYLEHDLPVLETCTRIREAFRALAGLPSGPFAEYDEASGHVWIPCMAQIRLNLAAGDHLHARDKRHRAVVRLYEALAPNPFLGACFDRYATMLRLPQRRESTPRGSPPLLELLGARPRPLLPSSQAPSKPLTSPFA